LDQRFCLKPKKVPLSSLKSTMEAVIQLFTDQPVVAVVAAVLAIVILQAALSSSPTKVEDPVIDSSSRSAPAGGKKKKKKKKAAEVAEPVPEPVVAPPVVANGGGSKKKKKKKAAAPEPIPEPVPEPAPVVVANGGGKKKKKKKAAAPAPAPEPVPEPEPVVVANGGGKKKKKKNSKAAAAVAPVVADKAPEPQADDSDDDDDDALLTFAKGGRPDSKKKKPVDTNTDNGGGWSTIGAKNGTVATTTTSTQASSDKSNGAAAITLNLTPQDVPILIGPKGATIQRIQSATGARLDVDKSGGDQAKVKITGSEHEIAFAMEEVQTLLSTESAKRLQASAHTVTLSGASIKGSDGIKAIIGRGGSIIQKIESTTGCKLNASINDGTVVITGSTDEAVAAAETMCKNAVFGESNKMIDLGSRSMVFCVCGRSFTRLQQIQTESGARLDVEKGTAMLTISGDTEHVESARQLVMQRMKLCQGMSMTMESSKIGALFGKGGTNLRKIQEDTGAFVEVAQSGETADCKILGEPDAVKAAHALVLKSLSGEVVLKPGEVLSSVELGVGTPAVIGRGGSKIAELERTHTVKINVQGATGGCTIVGKKDAVAAAKEEIEGIVKPLIEKAVAEASIREQAEEMVTNGDDTWGAVSETGAGAWESTVEDTGW
jgi:rRNA processing protein Krr1/Pno1